DANGCQQSDQVILNTYKADAGPDKGNCAGAGVMIGTEAPAGATGISYLWTRISGSGIGTLSCTTCATPIASPTATTVYQVQMTVTKSNGGTCSTTDQVTVTPVTAPTANFAGADRVVCIGSTTTLGSTAQSGYTYLWSPGTYIATSNSTATFDAGSINMPTPNPITYVVTATKDGCVFADEVKVAVIEAKAGVDGCGPRTLGVADRTPNINETYAWTKVAGPGTGNFIGPTNQRQASVSASVGGDVTYRLTTTYTLNGVTGTCTDDVVVPASCGTGGCSITVKGDAGCPSNSLSINPVTFTAIPSGLASDFTYSWSPAVGLNTTTAQKVSLTDNVHRTYTVTMTSKIDPTYTCTASVEANNPVWSVPGFNGPSPISACSGVPVAIGDPANNPGYSYTWSGIGLSSSNISLPNATAPDDQTYIVTVTDKVTGCSLNDTIEVYRSVAANAGVDKNVCINGTVKLGVPAESGYTYSWSPAGADWRNGTNQNSAEPEVFVAVNTTFTLTKTHTASGCVTTDDVEVNVGSALAPFTMSPLSYCPGSTTALYLGYSTGTTSGVNQVPTGAGYTY
ncbi:hypothetical protein, partial [Dyadobacter jejuensis]|uniref:hypothetical protein n=1 Tax=Dyadobacter jejuensis TaxID=1082580 RepID=UPI001304D2D9